MYQRYAIYFVPDGPWGDFGAQWLGWDSRTGQAHAAHAHSDWTMRPRNYGFHATLKAPFRMADGCHVDQLTEKVIQIATSHEAIALRSLGLEKIGPFFALTAPEEHLQIRVLADDLVQLTDMFRAPLTSEELAKRRQSRLSALQEENLQNWGYPNVLDAYQFHVTLTGRVKDPDTVRAVLANAFDAPQQHPLTLSDVCVMGEDANGQFHVIDRIGLTGGR